MKKRSKVIFEEAFEKKEFFDIIQKINSLPVKELPKEFDDKFFKEVKDVVPILPRWKKLLNEYKEKLEKIKIFKKNLIKSGGRIEYLSGQILKEPVLLRSLPETERSAIKSYIKEYKDLEKNKNKVESNIKKIQPKLDKIDSQRFEKELEKITKEFPD